MKNTVAANGHRLDAAVRLIVQEVATSNAACAVDQAGEYGSRAESTRQHRLNMVDTLSERVPGMSPRTVLWAVEEFEEAVAWYIRSDRKRASRS
jgi:hypothetical protein